jgi:hypothetical protein
VMVMVGVPDDDDGFASDSFVTIDPGFGDDVLGEPGFGEDEFVDPYEDDPFDEEPPYAEDVFGDPNEEPSSFVADDPVESERIAATSITIGLAYAVAAAVADRLRRRRGASAAWLAAALAMAFGVLFLADAGLEVWGAALVGLLLGAGLLAFGALGGHRFTAWNGGAVAVVSIGVLVADRLGESTLVSGLVLLVVGVALAVAAALLGGPGGGTVEEPAPHPPPGPV